MTKYKLLKDIPYAKKGEVFKRITGWLEIGMHNKRYYLEPKDLPEWFEKVDGRWKPSIKQKYWVVDSVGDVGWNEWANDKVDNEHYDHGNCREHKSEAKEAAKKIKKLLLSLHKD